MIWFATLGYYNMDFIELRSIECFICCWMDKLVDALPHTLGWLEYIHKFGTMRWGDLISINLLKTPHDGGNAWVMWWCGMVPLLDGWSHVDTWHKTNPHMRMTCWILDIFGGTLIWLWMMWHTLIGGIFGIIGALPPLYCGYTFHLLAHLDDLEDSWRLGTSLEGLWTPYSIICKYCEGK